MSFSHFEYCQAINWLANILLSANYCGRWPLLLSSRRTSTTTVRRKQALSAAEKLLLKVLGVLWGPELVEIAPLSHTEWAGPRGMLLRHPSSPSSSEDSSKWLRSCKSGAQTDTRKTLSTLTDTVMQKKDSVMHHRFPRQGYWTVV